MADRESSEAGIAAVQRNHPLSTTRVAPWWSRFLLALVCAGALLLTIAGLRRFRWAEPHLTEIIVGVMLVVALYRTLQRGWLSCRLSNRAFLLTCLGLFVFSRLAAVLLAPTEPVSDFASYYRMADAMAGSRDVRSVYGFFAWGYPLALAPWFACCGSSILLAKLLNVVAGAAALYLVYRLGSVTGGSGVARCAAVLFLLWPAQLFLTPVLASEHLALLLALAYVLCLIKLPNTTRASGVGLLGGIVLGMAGAVRPALGVLLPVGVIAGFVAVKPRRRVVCVALLVAGFVSTQLGYRGLLWAQFQRTPPTVAWWNLLAGTNYEARGQWNREDAEQFSSFGSLKERNRYARAEIWHRITSRSLLAHANLIRRKLQLLWGDAYYGVYWSTHTMADTKVSEWVRSHVKNLYTCSQLQHLSVLILGAAGAFGFIRREYSYPALLLSLLILSGSVLHAVFETQSRYAYVFTVGLLVFAACAIAGPAPSHRRRMTVKSRICGVAAVRGAGNSDTHSD
jgi:hypothetical protein